MTTRIDLRHIQMGDIVLIYYKGSRYLAEVTAKNPTEVTIIDDIRLQNTVLDCFAECDILSLMDRTKEEND